MKRLIMLALVAVLAIVSFSGCAQVGPVMVSPFVYRSSEKATVKANEAKEEKEISNAEGERQARERAKARHAVALNEIRGEPFTTSEESTDKIKPKRVITAEGIVGGFQSIFINDSETNKEIVVKKLDGDFAGYKWRFYLPKKGGQKKFKLETGLHEYQWTTESDSRLYPEKPKTFNVTPYPHYWDDRAGENFHGGVRLFGY